MAQLVDSSQYHVLSPRAMENFRDAGIADKGDAKDAAAQNMQATAWYAGLAGPHDGHGREIGRLEAWGGATPTPITSRRPLHDPDHRRRALRRTARSCHDQYRAGARLRAFPRGKHSYPNDFTTE